MEVSLDSVEYAAKSEPAGWDNTSIFSSRRNSHTLPESGIVFYSNNTQVCVRDAVSRHPC